MSRGRGETAEVSAAASERAVIKTPPEALGRAAQSLSGNNAAKLRCSDADGTPTSTIRWRKGNVLVG